MGGGGVCAWFTVCARKRAVRMGEQRVPQEGIIRDLCHWVLSELLVRAEETKGSNRCSGSAEVSEVGGQFIVP